MTQKYNKQHITGILIVSFLLFSAFTVFAEAEQFNSVRGLVYINGDMAETNLEIQIHFDDEILKGKTFEEDEDTYYNIGFSGHEEDNASIYLLFNGDLIAPNTNKTFTIHTDEFLYRYDLSFNVSGSASNSDNQQPIADPGGPYTGKVQESISFDGSGSNDPDGSITKFSWDFGDGDTGSGINPAHVYSNDGSYTVVLTVTDNDGATAEKATSVRINPLNSKPNLPVINVPENITANSTFYISISATDPDNDQIKFQIDWKDDSDLTMTDFINSGSSIEVSHTYENNGFFIINVIAIDENNAESSDKTQTIIVKADTSSNDADEGGFPLWIIFLLIIIIVAVVIVFVLFRTNKLPIAQSAQGQPPVVVLREFFNTKILRKEPSSTADAQSTSDLKEPSTILPTPISDEEDLDEEESEEVKWEKAKDEEDSEEDTESTGFEIIEESDEDVEPEDAEKKDEENREEEEETDKKKSAFKRL